MPPHHVLAQLPPELQRSLRDATNVLESASRPACGELLEAHAYASVVMRKDKSRIVSRKMAHDIVSELSSSHVEIAPAAGTYLPGWMVAHRDYGNVETIIKEERLRDALNEGPTARTDIHIQLIDNFLMNVWPTASMLGPKRVSQISKTARFHRAKRGEVIVREGERGLTFFIVVSGTVDVCKMDGASTKLATLRSGFSFGEASLGHGAPLRNATIVCSSERAELLVLHKADYDLIMSEFQRSEHRRTMRVMKQVPLFSSWSRRRLDGLCDMLQRRHYARGSVIVRQGDLPDNVYFVLDGHCVVYKDVYVKKRNRWPTGARTWVVKVCTETVNVTLMNLGPGAHFGEKGILEGKPRGATVVASTDVHVVSLDKIAFEGLLKNSGDGQHGQIDLGYADEAEIIALLGENDESSHSRPKRHNSLIGHADLNSDRLERSLDAATDDRNSRAVARRYTEKVLRSLDDDDDDEADKRWRRAQKTTMANQEEGEEEGPDDDTRDEPCADSRERDDDETCSDEDETDGLDEAVRAPPPRWRGGHDLADVDAAAKALDDRLWSRHRRARRTSHNASHLVPETGTTGLSKSSSLEALSTSFLDYYASSIERTADDAASLAGSLGSELSSLTRDTGIDSLSSLRSLTSLHSPKKSPITKLRSLPRRRRCCAGKQTPASTHASPNMPVSMMDVIARANKLPGLDRRGHQTSESDFPRDAPS